MKILVFGDVVGRPGRDAVTKILPKWRERYQPDAVIVNIENIANGRGLSQSTVEEALQWKADLYTTGDHAWDTEESKKMLEKKDLPIIRPANYPNGVPGRGYASFNVGARKVMVINLQGQVFFKNNPNNPFHTLDELLNKEEIRNSDLILAEFHAEATSEKRAFGWHVDGRLAAVWGTHTHVPTADAQILPQGTGYISDVGMNGLLDSIIGGSKKLLKSYQTQIKMRFEAEEAGRLECNAVLIEVDPSVNKAKSIALCREILND